MEQSKRLISFFISFPLWTPIVNSQCHSVFNLNIISTIQEMCTYLILF